MNVTHVALIVALASSLLAAPVEGQPPGRMPRVAILSPGSPPPASDPPPFLVQGLRELDYTDGQNVAIEARSTHVDPVGTGLVVSLARPSGNLTGFTLMAPELAGKRLELLREPMSGVSRLAVLMNPANPGFEPTLRQTESAARSLNVRLHLLEANAPAEFERAFASMAEQGAAALHVQLDPMFLAQRDVSSSSPPRTAYRPCMT